MHVTPSPRSVCGFERLGIVGTYGMGMKGVASNAALKGTDTKKNQLNHASKIKNIDAKLKGKDRRVLKAFRPIGSELLGGKGLNEGGYGEDAGPADGVQSAMEKDVNGANHVSGVKVHRDNSIKEHYVNENVLPKEDVNNATNVNEDFVHGNTSPKISFASMFKNTTVDDNIPLNEGVDNISKANNDSDYVPGSSSPKSSFDSMFKNTTSSEAIKLTEMKSNEEVQRENVAIPLAVVEEINTRFQNTLYGYFIGKRLRFPLVENYVKNAWAKFRLDRVMLTNGFFFFQFATREGMEWVLENGPWLILLVPIMLNIWKPNTRFKKDTITYDPVWVKIHHVPIMAFSEIGLSLITSLLGRPIMLDAYTSSMCQKSWGRNTYVRALIEISALSTLKDSLIVAISFPNGTVHSLETVEIEYEWQPPRCDVCKIFDHKDYNYPKWVKVVETTQDDGDGFIQITRKNGKGNQGGQVKQVACIRLSKPKLNLFYQVVQKHPSKDVNASTSHQPNKEASQPKQPTARCTNSMDEGINMLLLRNSFETLMEEDKILDVDDNIQIKSNADNDPLDDDDEEVEEVYHKQISSISVKPNDSKGASTPYGENLDIVNVVVVSFDDRVIHACVYFKADKKELFCSFVYAHNRYIHHRALWHNLVKHKGYIRNRPWCVLGDFNVSLHVDKKSIGSSYIDTGMHDFQECVDNIEVSDVNCTGLRFTWNQKPKGEDGILKKIDRIMANLEFCVSFVGSKRFLVQKAKVEWLKLGDANTSYFHKVVKSQASRNRIDSVSTSDGVFVDGDQVPMAFIDHYTAFLGQQGVTSHF
ncbi:retrovirus-related pol polyprotein from transposon 17.6, partial [Tanacetum coccineum]